VLGPAHPKFDTLFILDAFVLSQSAWSSNVNSRGHVVVQLKFLLKSHNMPAEALKRIDVSDNRVASQTIPVADACKNMPFDAPLQERMRNLSRLHGAAIHGTASSVPLVCRGH
jgi:hypothetical protein